MPARYGAVGTAGSYDAIVLAGGTSRRMGGGDKTSLASGGVPLLDRVLDALTAARRIIVVGQERPVSRDVCWTREEPPGGGPAAALAAGLAVVSAPVVAVLAADLPFVTAFTVSRLVAQAKPTGAVLVDAIGAPQWLIGAWPSDLLRGAFVGDQAGNSLHRSLAPLGPVLIAPGEAPPEWFDCDEPADLRAAESLHEAHEGAHEGAAG
jgi:molybdenum cofactor guanylyltransferase